MEPILYDVDRKSGLLRSIIHLHRRHPALHNHPGSSHNNLAPYGLFWPIELVKVLGLAEKGSRRQK
jgi:hypothetical protein